MRFQYTGQSVKDVLRELQNKWLVPESRKGKIFEGRTHF
jgi:hypothetical protein